MFVLCNLQNLMNRNTKNRWRHHIQPHACIVSVTKCSQWFKVDGDWSIQVHTIGLGFGKKVRTTPGFEEYSVVSKHGMSITCFRSFYLSGIREMEISLEIFRGIKNCVKRLSHQSNINHFVLPLKSKTLLVMNSEDKTDVRLFSSSLGDGLSSNTKIYP